MEKIFKIIKNMIFLHNSLTRQVEEFKPIKKNQVKMYACGPTVYNFAHLGNLRTYVFEDLLKRVLKFNNLKVKHVVNITDVGHLTSDQDEGEDKMEKGAKREGKTAWDIAAFYTQAFIKDINDLNILPPDIWCRATEHIKDQIKLIKKLEKKGFTYQTADGIYFDTSRLSDYGKIANLQNQELRAGVRVDIGDKKNITDFALWKFSPKIERRQMEWKSPWGIGFPGWHIECSAMSMKYLGEHFDIHCGGIDHIPVHHTNEIAQSETATGKKPWVNYWLHGEFLLTDSEKMAKSDGNFLTLQLLKDKGFNPLAYRYFLLQTHYRKQLNFSWEALQAAQNGLERLWHTAKELKEKNESSGKILPAEIKNNFLEKINNDLDIPGALALVWKMLNENKIDFNTLNILDEVLGLKIKENINLAEKPIPEDVKIIVADRDAARAAKNWAKSDALRQDLEKMGYQVKDTPAGTKIER